ncbi:hypothetical protein M5689_008609 [Euphorbia peplus]|nr:hypothetical protein M5689_008609 [Euphorbia peplus]
MEDSFIFLIGTCGYMHQVSSSYKEQMFLSVFQFGGATSVHLSVIIVLFNARKNDTSFSFFFFGKKLFR